jgi:hypothetical protein
VSAPPGYRSILMSDQSIGTPARGSFGHTHHTYYNIASIHAALGREEPAFKRLVADLEQTYSALKIQRL